MPADGVAEQERRRITSGRLLVAAIVVFAVMYGLVPQLPGLRNTVRRLGTGDGSWLLVGAGFEVLSFAGYVVVFHTVFADGAGRIGWRVSYQLTMAGVVATRLLAAGGAGGIALTVWALSHAGFDATELRRRMAAFLVLLYSVFMAALLLGGLGLRTGVLAGRAPFGLTVVTAAFGATVIALALALALVPVDLGHGANRRVTRFLATVPATVSAGVRGAIELLRSRNPGLLGAPAWWAFDIAVLWSCLHAFGTSAPVGVLVVAYFTGMLGNLLPLPGGVGGVEGGMVGALLGFGVPSGPAILGVLAYRAFAFWLPILPGALAYVRLRRTVRDWDEEAGATPG